MKEAMDHDGSLESAGSIIEFMYWISVENDDKNTAKTA